MSSEQAPFNDLYWSIGDGGPQNDPADRAQDVSEYHGSIIRISVSSSSGATGYEIPSDNPFASGGDAFSYQSWGRSQLFGSNAVS